MRKSGLVPFLLALLWVGAAPARHSTQAEEFRRHLWFLASDELKGRGNNRPEIDQTAEYIAGWFRRYGLVPGGDNRTYFHEFEARTQIEVGPATRLTLELQGEGSRLDWGVDYVALFSGPPCVVAPLAFAGFGITAPEIGYDDYSGLDAKGKVIAVFQHEPEEDAEGSRFAGKDYSPWATVTYKAANARRHGALGLIVLPDPQCDRDRTWKPDTLAERSDIPVVKVTEEWSRRLLRLGPLKPNEIARAAKQLLLRPFVLPGARVSLRVEVVERNRVLKNVVGILPGTRDDCVVIGAHYDHLGLGERKALAPQNVGQIHNGADDNASGTAGMLSLAYQLSGTAGKTTSATLSPARGGARPVRRLASPRRGSGVLFVAFAGEELGLLGSSAFVSRPPVPLSKMRAMVNLDMIGRSGGTVDIGGVGTASEFRSWLDALTEHTALKLNHADTPQAPSDHLSFVGEKIPVLFFFSGLHPDYHQPSDDREKIDQVRALEIVGLVKAMTRRLVESDQPPHFIETDSSAALLGASFGAPVFGIATDPSWEADGVLVSGAKPASPASSAGFRQGDLIIGCDGKAIMNRLDLVEQLRRRQPDTTTQHIVIVLRGGDLLSVLLSVN